MYYYGARYYNPRESVWISTDPLVEINSNMLPYSYVLNNPTNYIDPTGLFETRKEARQYRKQHGIDGGIHKNKDGGFSIDDSKNHTSYTRSMSPDMREAAGEDGVLKSTLVIAKKRGLESALDETNLYNIGQGYRGPVLLYNTIPIHKNSWLAKKTAQSVGMRSFHVEKSTPYTSISSIKLRGYYKHLPLTKALPSMGTKNLGGQLGRVFSKVGLPVSIALTAYDFYDVSNQDNSHLNTLSAEEFKEYMEYRKIFNPLNNE